MRTLQGSLIFAFTGLLLLTSCGISSNLPQTPESTIPVVEQNIGQPSATPFQPAEVRVFFEPGIPQSMRKVVKGIADVVVVDTLEESDLAFRFLTKGEQEQGLGGFTRVYAVLAPFFTVEDGLSVGELHKLWKGDTTQASFQSIFATEEIVRVLDQTWGKHGGTVQIGKNSDIESLLSETPRSIAILPFEEIDPRFKVLKLDGISPLDKPMNMDAYGLTFQIQLFQQAGASAANLESVANSILTQIPESNRDESRMTVIVMSGTTAITRGTAAKVVLKGTDYPIEAVKYWFLSADLRHVSNEISFTADCPEPDPYTSSLRFCAQPGMIEVLEKLDVNLVELTGNHENDYGSDNFASTLSLYKEKGWNVFGGGLNAEEAKKPLLLEVNGNKVAFIGCNPAGPPNDWATEDKPGTASCDYDYYYSTIKSLKEQGYIVIATFQHAEIYQYMYAERYRADFQAAVEAGADIVQGSQAHYPMGFELIGNQLIHYGLGNFLFDQMDYPVVGTRREFIDRHVLYDGRYLNTELLTALLTDWSRPVPMIAEERENFLTDLFSVSVER